MRSIAVLLALAFGSAPVCAQEVVIYGGASEEMGAGGQIVTGPEGITVENGGKLSFIGSSTSLAQYLGSGPRGEIHLEPGAVFHAKYAHFKEISHLFVHSGAKIERLHDSTFEDLGGTALEACEWIDGPIRGEWDTFRAEIM